MRLSDLQSKNIVNVLDGKNVGSIIDVNVNEMGQVESLVIENSKKFLSFSKDEETIVFWKDITKIGEDVILVNKNNNYK
ncbi:MAG: YlmC/YmxH family sporulation protein [Bacilli bacterium]|nr:YlmC/YmxH family sporulation protein [Bacilli bacterium]